jgi:flagellar motor switch protein FliG
MALANSTSSRRTQSLRYVEMSGAHRSAVVLMSLSEAAASKVLAGLSEDDIRAIGEAMADLEQVEAPAVEAVLLEYAKDLLDCVHVPVSGRHFALHVLPDLVGTDRRQDVAGHLERSLSTDFQEQVAAVPPMALAALLKDELPQVRAIALLLMDVETASGVLACMTEADQFEMTRRMGGVSDVSDTVVRDVQASLEHLLGPAMVSRLTLHGVEQTARMLSRMGKTHSEPLLARIAKADKALAESIRRNMVLFSDLAVLQDRAIQALLKEVDASDLVLALRGTPRELRDLFLRNVSKRRREDLLEELEIMSPVPRSRAEEARFNVVETALRLHEEGVLFFPIGADAEELV